MPLHRRLNLCLSLLVLEILTTRIGTATAAAGQSQIAKPDCPDKCGNVSVPLPFGMMDGCYLNSSTGFLVNCTANGSLFFSPKSASYVSSQFQVSDISTDGHLYVYTPVLNACSNQNTSKSIITSPEFPFSSCNKFTAVGCDTLGIVYDGHRLAGCLTFCTNETDFSQVSSCSGGGCCQTSNLTTGLWNYTLLIGSILNRTQSGGKEYPCSSVFLAGETYCEDTQNPSGYICKCSHGFEGNPYLEDGLRMDNKVSRPWIFKQEQASCSNGRSKTEKTRAIELRFESLFVYEG